MKTRRKVLALAAMALVLTLSSASVALAHGAVADGHAAVERLSGVGRVVSYLPPLFVLIYYATRHRE